MSWEESSRIIHNLGFEPKNFVCFSEFVIAINEKKYYLQSEDAIKFLFSFISSEKEEVVTFFDFKETFKRVGFSLN